MKNLTPFLFVLLLSCGKDSNDIATSNNANVIESISSKGNTQNTLSSGGVYKAYLSQLGTSNPTIQIFENTIGAVTWTRFSIGNYQGVLTGAFPTNKTFVPFFGAMGGATQIPIAWNVPGEYYYTVVCGSDGNSISLQVYDSNYNNVDLSTISGEGQALPIWIEVYP
jgi:hypothetical protein